MQQHGGNNMTTTVTKTASGLPTDRINEFWREVEAALGGEHGVQGEHALRAILRYRDEVDGVGGMVYHQSPSDLAKGLIDGGYVKA